MRDWRVSDRPVRIASRRNAAFWRGQCHALFASPSSHALAGALFVSCGIADAHAQSAQKVSLRMDWVISGYHTPYFVGIKNGYYKGEGLDVTVEPGNGSGNVAQAIGNGNGDLATVDGGAMMQLVAKGLPVKAVMGWFQRNPDWYHLQRQEQHQ